MVSFDIVSLFTKVPIRETMDLLGRHFEEDVLTTSYFTFNGQFYGQTDGVAMGSPLSPVIANFYMEDYEKAALESAPLKPRCWFRYGDDTFVIWQHGPDKLKDFLYHVNSIHQSRYCNFKYKNLSCKQISIGEKNLFFVTYQNANKNCDFKVHMPIICH
jgi:hypothetical protein